MGGHWPLIGAASHVDHSFAPDFWLAGTVCV